MSDVLVKVKLNESDPNSLAGNGSDLAAQVSVGDGGIPFNLFSNYDSMFDIFYTLFWKYMKF